MKKRINIHTMLLCMLLVITMLQVSCSNISAITNTSNEDTIVTTERSLNLTSSNAEYSSGVLDDLPDHTDSEKTDSQPADLTYSFVWMSDTQYYSESYPDIYNSLTKWIVNNVENNNIKFVIHTGDVTNRCFKGEQWVNAHNAMQLLDGVVPYSVLAGNHDITIDENTCDYKYFLVNYGQQVYPTDSSILWYKFGESRAHLLDVGSTKYLILALGWNADADTFAWANDILKTYQDRIAIITTHNYLYIDGSLTINGNTIYNNIVVPNKNVRLVLSGHFHSQAQNIAHIDDNKDGTADRTVYQLISDYQSLENGGNGYMRLLTFDENKKELNIRTYSPYLNSYCSIDEQTDNITIPISEWFNKQ